MIHQQLNVEGLYIYSADTQDEDSKYILEKVLAIGTVTHVNLLLQHLQTQIYLGRVQYYDESIDSLVQEILGVLSFGGEKDVGLRELPGARREGCIVDPTLI